MPYVQQKLPYIQGSQLTDSLATWSITWCLNAQNFSTLT